MTHVGDGIYMRPGKGGSRRYYLRVTQRFFENGIRKRKERWVALGPSLDRARETAKQFRASLDAELRGEPPKPDLTLGQAVDWYLKTIEQRGLLGWKTVRSNLNGFQANVGDMPLRRIRREDVENYLAVKARTVKPITVNAVLRDLKRLFSATLDAGYLDAKPTHRVKMMRVAPNPCKLPSALEVERLMQASPEWLARILLVLVSTGCRLGESLRLDWSDVDFTGGLLKLRRTKVNDELEMRMGDRLKEDLWRLNLGQGGPTRGPVFVTRLGRPPTRERVYRVFKGIAVRLGWPWLTLKTFRKLVATEIWRRTRDVRAVQKTLGHSRLSTSELYMLGDEEARERGVEAMDGFLKETTKTPV